MQNDPVRLGSVAVIKLLRNPKLVKRSIESNRIDFEIGRESQAGKLCLQHDQPKFTEKRKEGFRGIKKKKEVDSPSNSGSHSDPPPRPHQRDPESS